MKPPSYSASFLTLVLACAPAVDAATTVLTDNSLMDIPDGSSSGLARVLPLSSTLETIDSLELTLQIAAKSGSEAFLGDLYVYLTNGTDIAVLLNRSGRTLTVPAGYADNQTLDVNFTNSALNDIHNYRFAATGNASTPLSGPLTGTWLADGRMIDPANVLDTDAPSARLDVFNGGAAAQDWTLFVADLSGGAQHQLVSWSLTLETVPEPSSLLLSLCTLPLLLRRRR
jgi:hypothetical protein